MPVKSYYHSPAPAPADTLPPMEGPQGTFQVIALPGLHHYALIYVQAGVTSILATHRTPHKLQTLAGYCIDCLPVQARELLHAFKGAGGTATDPLYLPIYPKRF